MSTTTAQPRRSRRKPRDLAEVLAILRPRLAQLREDHGIVWLGVFGSYARGEQRRGSDIDLLVEFDGRVLSLLGLARVERGLARIMHGTVDLVERESLRGCVGERILEEAVPV
jgi:predicted nucleotidyltransferase